MLSSTKSSGMDPVSHLSESSKLSARLMIISFGLMVAAMAYCKAFPLHALTSN